MSEKEATETVGKNVVTHQRHVETLAAQGFIPVSLIHHVAGVSRTQWFNDLKAYRKSGNMPPLRINNVTGKEGYLYPEFIAWLEQQTALRSAS